MEDLNRRHSVIRTQSPHEAGQDSPASNRSVVVVVDQEPGADPGDQQMFSKKNSLTVVVQQRRASIISINNQAQGHVPDSSLLDVSNSNHTRSASIRSSHSNKHLQVSKYIIKMSSNQNERLHHDIQIPFLKLYLRHLSH